MKDQEFELILRQAMQMDIAPEETIVHPMKSGKGTVINMKSIMKKACLAAALMTLLTTTVYAAGGMKIKTLLGSSSSRIYETVAQAEQKAGFQMDDLDTFSNGYGFVSARVGENRALDQDDKVRFVYNDIAVELKNTTGDELDLIAHEARDDIPTSDTVPSQIRTLGEVRLEYRLHHYKFVPENYELTDRDKTMMEQPGYYISYGSESIEETDVAFLNWEKDGICYTLMDSDGSESSGNLFAMAEELILKGK